MEAGSNLRTRWFQDAWAGIHARTRESDRPELEESSEGGISCVFRVRSSEEDARRFLLLDNTIIVLLFGLSIFLHWKTCGGECQDAVLVRHSLGSS